MTRRLWLLVALATLFGFGHHVDHLIRGNHVGWPVSAAVTPFTYSLAVYPLIALGAALARRGRVGAGYWAILSAAGLLFVGALHFGPFAVEPPADILGPYRSRVAGWLALGWLVLFLAVLGVTALYATVLWHRGARARAI